MYSQAQLERFLEELTNLRLDLQVLPAGNILEAIERFRKRFAAFIPAFDRDSLIDMAGTVEGAANEPPLKEFEPDWVWIALLQGISSRLWLTPGLRQREWQGFIVRHLLYDQQHSDSKTTDILSLDKPIPPPTPFEQALVHLVNSAARARHCSNPQCPSPFFFATRKNQRYCTEKCAGHGQRELKRNWWAEHGKQWRMAREGGKPVNKSKPSKQLRQTADKGRKK